jgi:hypothetical protein
MRLAVLSAVAAMTLLTVGASSARTVIVGGKSYVWLEPSMFNANVSAQSMEEVESSDTLSSETPRAIYEHAFFTPVPNYQQSGYQCAGMVSVKFQGGVRHLHRGTYCIR